jgi:putative heme iron utilization protein
MSESAKLAKAALVRAKIGSLATLEPITGAPYVSLVNFACDEKGLPIFLFSKLARHTKCLLADPRASLLIAEVPATGDALTGFRATFMGRMSEQPDKALANLYCQRHPEAAVYLEFGDFSFWRFVPESIHMVAGFGRIETLPATAIFDSA